ncbi:dihydrodipicolinate synthase family protein [Fibrisoma montanum]|uniref:Dihydrodipicolinate synthase family protein n=1 Tax=Fibrisoma montanum TaxID=2305895 RepID=A0A418MJC6_9BACT|nr:dihydrodipicolinate synthase family protein [Fibrisoma montanum]RIV27453.1 dihydrodipicolinate synthase family protein [Fibrisoma montanum]
MTFTFQGVFPALTTKFTADDQLDIPMFRTNLQAQLDAGVDGVILGGSLGEASTLTTEEKETLVRTAVEHIDGQVPVVLNIAEGATRDAIRIAERAADLGASGLMALPPMRYKADDRETTAYFKAIAQSTDLPIMIYNNPVDYKIDVTLDMFAELLAFPNIQAVKESTRDVSNVTRLRNRFGDRIKILCGVDTLAMEELVMGADGWVAGLVCAFPRETVAVYRLVKAGRFDEARAIYRWFLPLLELDIHPKLVQYIKLAETATGIGTEHVRAPRLPLIDPERQRILSLIEDGLANRPALPEELVLAN